MRVSKLIAAFTGAVRTAAAMLPELAAFATAFSLTLEALHLYSQYKKALGWGDVHLTTFDKLLSYNFQAEGEFVLAASAQPNNSYQVQIRLQPYGDSYSVTIMTQIAAAVGNDRVTFDLRLAPTPSGLTEPVHLERGQSSRGLERRDTLRDIHDLIRDFLEFWRNSPRDKQWLVSSLSTQLGSAAHSGAVKGLLGSDSGKANDFQLADGTVLAQPLTTAQLYGEYANAWRVSQTTSLLDDGPGQTTATFTNLNFPTDPVSLSDLPAALVTQAAQAVAAAGITDPNVAAAAEFDYAETGDPSFISGAATVSQGLPTTTLATVVPYP